jgi:hypothetical protein
MREGILSAIELNFMLNKCTYKYNAVGNTLFTGGVNFSEMA